MVEKLTPLIPTEIVEPEYIIGKRDGKKYSKIHYMSVGKDPEERSRLRSKTFRYSKKLWQNSGQRSKIAI